MKRNSIYIAGILLSTMWIMYGFTGVNSYFIITKDDVKLIVPKGFPKPVYTFKNNTLTPEVFVLGRKLFYDPILSKDSSTSCASCHQRIAAFAHFDHPLSHGINGLIGKRNVSALQNLIWKDALMWDGGVNNLEVQPINPITNPVEMNESLANIIQKLKHNKDYVEEFNAAFHTNVINSEELLKSLAQFTGLMVSANSRYDKYIRKEDTFSKAEQHGLVLFRANCAACHKEPLFTDNSYRDNGIGSDTSLKDMGRGAITGQDADNMRFKVPSLRNIEMTYPYMHDGRFRNLEQVLNHYTHTAKLTDRADTVLKKGISLTEEDKKDLLAFLKTLTDKEFLYDRRFADPNMK